MIVLDASVVVELLLRTADASRIEDQVFGADVALHAPHLLDVEVAHVVRRYVVAGDLTAARGAAALDLLGAMPLYRHPHTAMLHRIWALRENLTAYDAAYVALAEGLDALLVTRDARLARAKGHTARVELL